MGKEGDPGSPATDGQTDVAPAAWAQCPAEGSGVQKVQGAAPKGSGPWGTSLLPSLAREAARTFGYILFK